MKPIKDSKNVYVDALMPGWFAKLIRPFCTYLFSMECNLCDHISNLIEDGELDEAENLLETFARTDKQGHANVHVIRLSTRITRIRIIGR